MVCRTGLLQVQTCQCGVQSLLIGKIKGRSESKALFLKKGLLPVHIVRMDLSLTFLVRHSIHPDFLAMILDVVTQVHAVPSHG